MHPWLPSFPQFMHLQLVKLRNVGGGAQASACTNRALEITRPGTPAGNGGMAGLPSPGAHDPLHPELRNLRERLEEEHAALVSREADKAALLGRIRRLTRLILHSSRLQDAATLHRRQRRALLRSYSAVPQVGRRACNKITRHLNL